MKKGFVSVLTLLVALVLALAITFIYSQNKNDNEYSRDLYNKKQAQYKAESVLNIYLANNYDFILKEIVKDDLKTNKATHSIKVDGGFRMTIDSKTYIYKLSYINRDDGLGQDDLYRLSTQEIQVGNSKAFADIYFKLSRDPALKAEEIEENLDKIKLTAVIKRSV